MFTGIVAGVGSITRVDPLEVDCPGFDLSDVALGDSICVQGVCLTVTRLTGRGFAANVSAETRAVTTGLERAGAKVNLEKSLAVGDRLGGHLVTGHVDGVAEVISFSNDILRLRAPKELARYIARKGSACVDGVSLTVNRVERETFEMFIIPHTRAVTTLGRLAAGARVNLEVDLIARYIERIVSEREGR